MRPVTDRRLSSAGRRAGNPSALVLGLGALGAALLGALYLYASGVAARGIALSPSASTPASAVPVLSARRAPSVLSVTTRTGRVARAVQPIAASVSNVGCLSVTWKGVEIANVNVAAPLTPASAIKIVTASVALEVLGKDHVFETSVHGSVDASGSATTLFLVGGGDPVLVSAQYPTSERYPTISGTSLEKLADAVVAAGVRSVPGGIIGVDSRYDAERYVAQWPASFRGVEGGPLGALMVNDGVVIGEPQKRDDPAVAAAAEFGRLLSARGVVVGGAPQRGTLPAGSAKMASVTSAPLVSVVGEMLTNSDNNTAELMLKEIGLAKKGAGTTTNGAAVVLETLASWGLQQGVGVVDGSGLSRENKIPCSTFLALLQRESQVMPPLMAVAGSTGTLRDAFTKEEIRGRLVGKTGTLSGVKSLVGYVPVEGDDPLMYVLVLNRDGIDNQSAYRPIWYALGSALNRAKAAPTPEQLSP